MVTMTNLYLLLLFCAGYMVAAMMQTATYLGKLNGENMTHKLWYRLLLVMAARPWFCATISSDSCYSHDAQEFLMMIYGNNQLWMRTRWSVLWYYLLYYSAFLQMLMFPRATEETNLELWSNLLLANVAAPFLSHVGLSECTRQKG